VDPREHVDPREAVDLKKVVDPRDHMNRREDVEPMEHKNPREDVDLREEMDSLEEMGLREEVDRKGGRRGQENVSEGHHYGCRNTYTALKILFMCRAVIQNGRVVD